MERTNERVDRGRATQGKCGHVGRPQALEVKRIARGGASSAMYNDRGSNRPCSDAGGAAPFPEPEIVRQVAHAQALCPDFHLPA